MQRTNKLKCFNAALETLESRTMMSAVTPTGGNDTTAIQNAINNTPAGQTVNLGAGTFHVSSTLNFDGRIIAGVAGQTTLQWTGSNNTYMIDTGSNSTLEGVNVSGAGIWVSDNSNNVTITNDVIENINGNNTYYNNAITGFGGSNNLNITHNTIQNDGGLGIWIYSINQSHLDYNTITNVYEGIHAINFNKSGAGNNCSIDHNTVTGITRHGIEIQNQWYNLDLGWNYVADFNVQPGGNSHIAMSIATGFDPGDATRAENVDVHDNVLLGNGPGVPSNPNYCFTAIEIMGDKSIVNNNYIANWGWGVLDGETTNWQDTNNQFVHVTSQNGDYVNEWEAGPPAVDSGNVDTANWNGQVPSAWANAGANGSGGDSSSGSSGTTVSAVNAPSNLTATSPSSSEIDLAWQNSDSTATYTVQIKSSNGTDPYVTVATLDAGTTSYKLTGLNPNWYYNILVTANENGQSSSPAFVKEQVQAPSVSRTSPITGDSGGKTSSSGSKTSGSTSKTSGSTSKTTDTTTKTLGSTSKSSGSTSKTTGTTTSKTKTTKTTKPKNTVSSTPVVAAAPGHGLVATFYKGRTTKKAVATQVDADVNYSFNGKSAAPALTSPAGKTNFNVVWTGQVEAPTSGKYTISTKSDDGIRVWIDNKEVINDWNIQPNTTKTGGIKLTAGKKYDIKVQYFQAGGSAEARLMWATKGMAREVIPDEDLYLPAAA